MQIKSEQGIASGIRRIEAMAGPSALDFLNQRDAVVREMTGQLKVSAADLPSKVSGTARQLIMRGMQCIPRTSTCFSQYPMSMPVLLLQPTVFDRPS